MLEVVHHPWFQTDLPPDIAHLIQTTTTTATADIDLPAHADARAGVGAGVRGTPPVEHGDVTSSSASTSCPSMGEWSAHPTPGISPTRRSARVAQAQTQVSGAKLKQNHDEIVALIEQARIVDGTVLHAGDLEMEGTGGNMPTLQHSLTHSLTRFSLSPGPRSVRYYARDPSQSYCSDFLKNAGRASFCDERTALPSRSLVVLGAPSGF